MKPYLEPRFLGVLLLKTRASTVGQAQVERFRAPYFVTPLATLQIEHLLYWGQQKARLRPACQEGKREWDYWFAEGIFQVEPADWDSAVRVARAMMRETESLAESWLVYLHATLAASSGATHYLSFQPAYRAVAKILGLKVLPEQL